MVDVEKVKAGLEHCDKYECIGCPYRGIEPTDYGGALCFEVASHDALEAIAQFEERIAIMQESMEALEKQLDDSDRINVVRCSECQYWQPPTYAEQEDGSTIGHCTATLNGQQTDAYWFCADGAR